MKQSCEIKSQTDDQINIEEAATCFNKDILVIMWDNNQAH